MNFEPRRAGRVHNTKPQSKQMILAILLIIQAIYSSLSFSFFPTYKYYARYQSLKMVQQERQELVKCLKREYSSFFNPMEKKFYENDVSFLDPIIKIDGIENYKRNVDMLAGRNTLGSILFKDAAIILHNFEDLSDGRLMTRWTLRVTAKLIPWKPTARFTGVSIYSLSKSGKILRQEDYWDSVNLRNGEYVPVAQIDGVLDFLTQLQDKSGAEMSAPELPYELLRRAKTYEVRRYPAYLGIETEYDQRPEGYDRLNFYCKGSNTEGNANIPYYSPTIMEVEDTATTRSKKMTWPLLFAAPGTSPSDMKLPEPSNQNIRLVERSAQIVAVATFQVPATEANVRGYSNQLKRDVERDGIKLSTSYPVDTLNKFTVCQYDALFSLNKRRNEVWLEVGLHPWGS